MPFMPADTREQVVLRILHCTEGISCMEGSKPSTLWAQIYGNMASPHQRQVSTLYQCHSDFLSQITWLVSSKIRNLNPNFSDFQARVYNLGFHLRNLGECFRSLVASTLTEGRERVLERREGSKSGSMVNCYLKQPRVRLSNLQVSFITCE